MFAAIKNLIPEPRQADQPRHYVGRHRHPDPIPEAPVSPAPPVSPGPVVTKPAEETETAAA
ncbi:hypothetical protein [Paractinoplanes durhamensis]|uniref:Uncharacterized protein n=1 Tax=Paractinoplanes durhamensis TaxID=113563 RepID=A0ABQ3ZCG1_9ACTN|nr:hypothetical protein [Actinoplanes durhamensis]GIE07511.1 hypothetical protein Adu01nite_88610 [Actinoplanes durhamensis]